MQDMMYGTDDPDVRSRMDDVARAIQTHPTVVQFSQRNTTSTGCLGTSKATGFQVTLQCYKSGGCGTKKSRSSSRRAVPRCAPAWRSFAAGSTRDTAVIVLNQCRLSLESSTTAEGLLASSAPHVMMRLSDATLRAAATNKVALEVEQEKDAAEKEKEDLQRELCCKRPRPEAPQSKRMRKCLRT